MSRFCQECDLMVERRCSSDWPPKPVFERTFADEAPGSAGWVGEEPAPPPAVQFTSGSEANKDKFLEIWPFQPFPLLYGSAGWLIDQPFWNWIWNPMRNIAKKRKMQDWVNEYPKNVKDNAKVRTWRAHRLPCSFNFWLSIWKEGKNFQRSKSSQGSENCRGEVMARDVSPVAMF